MRLQIDGAEGQIREQAERLSQMKALQGEADLLRDRLGELQQHSAAVEEEARLVPGLKSQVMVLTKQVRLIVSELAILSDFMLFATSCAPFCSVTIFLGAVFSSHALSSHMHIKRQCPCIKMCSGNIQLSARVHCLYFSGKSHDCSTQLPAGVGSFDLTSLQVEEMEGVRKDRDAKQASVSALQEEVQLHREQVRGPEAHV